MPLDAAPSSWLQAAPTLLAVCVVTLVALTLMDRLSRRSSLPLPPGPRGWPIIGNALDFPRRDRGPEFKELGERYGTYHVELDLYRHTQAVAMMCTRQQGHGVSEGVRPTCNRAELIRVGR